MRFVDASVLVAVIGPLLLAACSAGEKEGGAVPDDPRPAETARLDESRFLGEPLTVENLTVWPVFTDAPLEIGEFLTLAEAQAAGVATVRELGGAQNGLQQRGVQQFDTGDEQTVEVEVRPQRAASADASAGQVGQRGEGDPAGEAGNFEDVARRVAQQVANIAGSAEVGRLVVENKSDLPLLICAGTVVKGGNQDRQIGQDVVVAAGESIDVDAFCVEAGRWTNVRAGVANDGTFQVAKSMAPSKVRTKGQYLNDQQEVWNEVALARTVAFSADGVEPGQVVVQTRAGSTLVDALEEVDDEAATERTALRDRVAAHFRELDGAVGFAYAVNGKPVTVRAFAHSRLLAKHLEAFAETMAIEAQAAAKRDFPPASVEDVIAMVAEINAAAEKLEQTRGANMNGVRLAEMGFNSNCYVEDANDAAKKVPVTQDWTRR